MGDNQRFGTRFTMLLIRAFILLIRVFIYLWITDNLLPNGGFELGPAFLDNSSDGVLVDSEPSLTETVIPQ